MAIQVINIGAAPNDGAGDPLRTAFGKANENFAEIYEGLGDGAVISPLLTALKELATGENKFIYFTAADTPALADITEQGRALLNDADAGTQRTTLGFVNPILDRTAPGAIGGTTPSAITGTTITGTTFTDGFISWSAAQINRASSPIELQYAGAAGSDVRMFGNTGNPVFFDSTGPRLGIGTGSPATPLEVYGTAAAANHAARITNTATDGYSTLQLGDANAGVYRNGSAQSSYGGASSMNLIAVGAHAIGFATNNTMRAAIEGTGQIKISGMVDFEPANTGTQPTSNRPWFRRVNSSSIGWNAGTTSDALFLNIDLNANVVVGYGGGKLAVGGYAATDPVERFQVAGAGRFAGAANSLTTGPEGASIDYASSVVRIGHVNGASGSTKAVAFIQAGAEVGRFHTNNYFGRGEAGPTFSIHSTASTGIKVKKTNNASLTVFEGANNSAGAAENMIGFYDADSDLCGLISITPASNTTAYGTSSDRRLKENIVDADLSAAWTTMKTLPVRSFNFIADSGTSQLGFIADEVDEVAPWLGAVIGAPDAVNVDDEIVPQMMDYGRMTPLLAAVAKAAIDRIEALETRVAALEA